MKLFERIDGHFVTIIDPIEAQVITQLVGQVRELLTNSADSAADPAADPATDSATDSAVDEPRDAAVLRLLPDAYSDDHEAAAEFRRFTAAGLAEKKMRNADVVTLDLARSAASATPSTVELDGASVQAWLRSLTDVRLVLAHRLGIETDDAERATTNDNELMIGDLYDWLGWVQGSLVQVLDTTTDEPSGLAG